MQQDLSDFKFQYGLALSNSRVYIFTNSKNQILTISEKVGKFINGDTTDYVLFEWNSGNMQKLWTYCIIGAYKKF